MNAGVVQQVDTPQALYETPANLFVAGFIGSPQMNFLDAVVKANGNQVELDLGESKITISGDKAAKLIAGGYDGKTVVMGIRPEDCYDDEESLAKFPETTIESTVRVYELLGAEVYLYFDYAEANFTARVKPTTTARTGDSIKLALDANKLHFFDKETEQTITN
jgi:multiple sugar transport system ATP-binding protein